MIITRKTLDAINHAAFEVFYAEHKDAFTVNTLYIYEIAEGGRFANLILTATTQMNSNTIKDNGFSDAATVSLLFIADRSTKTLRFNGGVL